MYLESIDPSLIEEMPFTGEIRVASHDKFLKGPVPLWWLKLAWEECRPSALQVGLLLFYKRGLGATPRALTKKDMSTLALNRWSVSEALTDLERSKLVLVEKKGRRRVATLDLVTRRKD
jgi:hypothetical protein